MDGNIYRLYILEVFDEDVGRFFIIVENLLGKVTCFVVFNVDEELVFKIRIFGFIEQ